MSTEEFQDLVDQIERTPESEDEEHSRQIVRLRTTFFRTARGLRMVKDIAFVKRLSSGYQILDEDFANFGDNDFADRIANLHECADGLYEVETCNHSHDWETGCLDDYDYMLVPVVFAGPPASLFYRHQRT